MESGRGAFSLKFVTMGSVALFAVVNGAFFLEKMTMVLRVLFSKTKWWCPVISLSQGLLLINVLGNQILKKRGDREDQERWFEH